MTIQNYNKRKLMNDNNDKRKLIELEEGWTSLEKGITKLKNLLEGGPTFTSEEHIIFYTTVYNMSTQEPPYDYKQPLYDRYKETFADYIRTTVLPAVRERQHDDDDESMLRELVKRWNNHKIMVSWLTRFFKYLDRHFIAERQLVGLTDVGLLSFRDGVYAELQNDMKDAVIALIARERDGEQTDRALVKNVLEIFVEMGMGNLDVYEGDFEAAMLADTKAYYSRRAASWIEQYSHSEYMLKADECLKGEKERAWHYLPARSEPKLLETVEQELLTKNQAQLSAKQKSGSTVLLEG